MFDNRHAPRSEAVSPVTFRLEGRDAEGSFVNISSSGALVRFATQLPFGPEAVGQTVIFTSWYDVGALIRSPATAVRYIEEPESKLLAVRYNEQERGTP